MYAVDGRRQLPESELDHLAGFRGSTPVRVGNAAWDQAQLDVMGEVLDMAHRFADQLDPLDERTRRLLVWLANEAADSWGSPDAGMWEARDEQRQYLTSKVMCWVALDRAAELAPLLGAPTTSACWPSRSTGDQFQKVSYGERLARDLSTVLRPIDGAKHWTPEDHPIPIADAINELVDLAGGRGSTAPGGS